MTGKSMAGTWAHNQKLRNDGHCARMYARTCRQLRAPGERTRTKSSSWTQVSREIARPWCFSTNVHLRTSKHHTAGLGLERCTRAAVVEHKSKIAQAGKEMNRKSLHVLQSWPWPYCKQLSHFTQTT